MNTEANKIIDLISCDEETAYKMLHLGITAHAVVITDMGEAEVLLNDPGVEHGPISVSFGDFYLAWDEMANLYGLIRKK